jgi:hypothetical protein
VKLTVKLATGMLFGLCCLMGGTASAQGMGMGNGPGMPAFSEFDLNADGVIAENEFYKARAERIAKHAAEGRQMKNLKNAPTFTDIDTDGDGGISSDEFSAHQTGERAENQQARKTPSD